MWKDINDQHIKDFNKIVTHPLQSFEWGIFREKTGIKVIRKGFFEKGKIVDAFTLTIHKLPFLNFTIGYLPKGNLPTARLINELIKIGKKEKCIFIQLEPNVINDKMANSENVIDHKPYAVSKLVSSFHPLFTKNTLQLDLTKSEDALLKNMHPKTRYNIKIAQKHNVEIIIDNSKDGFEEYWRLMDETTKRQHFFAHTKNYHEKMWETLKDKGLVINDPPSQSYGKASKRDELRANLFLAKYKDQILTAWVIFTFKDTLYYPYGASSRNNKEVMAPNLIMWEIIRFGKKLGFKTFDMWGSLGENPDIKDPWYGFHKFKMGYNPKLVEFIGSFDLVINPILYNLYKVADKIRWFLKK